MLLYVYDVEGYLTAKSLGRKMWGWKLSQNRKGGSLWLKHDDYVLDKWNKSK